MNMFLELSLLNIWKQDIHRPKEKYDSKNILNMFHEIHVPFFAEICLDSRTEAKAKPYISVHPEWVLKILAAWSLP